MKLFNFLLMLTVIFVALQTTHYIDWSIWGLLSPIIPSAFVSAVWAIIKVLK